jgi:molybdate transport system ATP-binding protein
MILSDRSKPHPRFEVNARLGVLQIQIHLRLKAPWTVIFGPSGSGKSSILRVLAGILPGDATSGKHPRIASHLRGIAYAPQGGVLFPHLNVRENVAFGGLVRGFVEAPEVERAMETFALGGLAGRMPRDLSGGERQRVSLARAFAVPAPKLMLLDEPFTGVDRRLRDELLPRMRLQMAELGVPVISVTHDVEEALMLGAEVVRIEDGKVMAEGPAAEVLAAERERMLRVLQSSR